MISSTLLSRSLRKKSSDKMAFPHPKSRKDKYRDEDKPSRDGIVWNFVKRTVDVACYWNRKDDVNPANNRTCCGLVHDVFSVSAWAEMSSLGFGGRFLLLCRFMTLEPPWVANRESQRRIALRTRRSVAASRTSWPRGRRPVQWAVPREADPAHRSRCAIRQRPSK